MSVIYCKSLYNNK